MCSNKAAKAISAEKQPTLPCAWTRAIASICGSRAPSVTAPSLSPDSGTPFLGHTGRLLCLRYSRVVSSSWSQTFPHLLLRCLFFWALFPLSPSLIVWVHVWLVFLGTRPSSVQLYLLFVLTALRSVADTLWSASVTGDPTELFFSHLEGSAHCAHKRQSRTPRCMLSEPLRSISSQ